MGPARKHRSGAEAPGFIGGLMYGLKAVPFKGPTLQGPYPSKVVPEGLKPPGFIGGSMYGLKAVPFKDRGVPEVRVISRGPAMQVLGLRLARIRAKRCSG